jgi:hypothetical protein
MNGASRLELIPPHTGKHGYRFIIGSSEIIFKPQVQKNLIIQLFLLIECYLTTIRYFMFMNKTYLSFILVSVLVLALLNSLAQDTARTSFTDINAILGRPRIPDAAELNKNLKSGAPPEYPARKITLHSEHKLTISLSRMEPHMGENLYLSLKNKTSGLEIERKMLAAITSSFNVEFDGILSDSSYIVDFFADHNSDGRYEFGVDHAWRITVEKVLGDIVIPFVHNTNFTDIEWKYKLTVNFSGMTLHLNQVMKLYLRNNDTGAFIDSLKVDPVGEDAFSVSLFSIRPDSSYHIDFYVDLNENGTYDVPPEDHAWRIHLLDLKGDTTVNFVYNTNFTDIGLKVISGIDDHSVGGFITYPDPASDELIIKSGQDLQNITEVRIFSSTGSLIIDQSHMNAGPEVRVDVSSLKSGLYILHIGNGQNSRKLKFVKQ